MKLSHVLLSLLVCFSLTTPHKAEAVNHPLAVVQMATGAFCTYYTAKLCLIWYHHFKTTKVHIPFDPKVTMAYIIAGSLAGSISLIAGYQNL